MARSRLYLTTLSATLSAVLTTGCGAIGSVLPKDDTPGRIRIDSQPAGAAVYVMGRQVGVTPMTISDRDIYPVSYGMDVEQYYGKVILRKAGCEEFSRRLTRSDVRKGLIATLDCDSGAGGEPVAHQPPAAARPASPPQRRHIPSISPVPATASDQRLQQLKMLQQLRDQGVLSDQEEERLRRRILDAP